ncbi:hypothetical protein QJ857_gp0552 [Tupanvirus soda lake]|uniref:Uncharacterized protein n=2 Tax=Tupanvirus TaxID=2094720 RepID=A0A6N1NLU8_9VIRU|nr:hypothetical protein QJ857_gp0552 [Tupanvirus soda lake]QKU35489.1 hypothetical protein [Tupanvirus soda lake]
MSSVFFQISNFDFLEASRIYGSNKDFAIRIVSINDRGRENIVYLPEVTINELSMLAGILRLRLLHGIRNINELYGFLYNGRYYY